MPIWVAIELWDFGLLSRFFEGMAFRDRQFVASELGASDGQVLTSWLRALTFVRNVSAHHARLWNRTMADLVKLPPIDRCRWLAPLHSNKRSIEKLYGPLTCAQLLLQNINPASTWHDDLKRYIATFPKTGLLSIEAAGFAPGWDDEPVWQQLFR